MATYLELKQTLGLTKMERLTMQCRQVGDRIEITPASNIFTVKRDNQFIQTLDNPKFHGFDRPAKKVWTVLDTPETRMALQAKGCPVVPGPRNYADMWADLDRLTESLGF